MRRTASVRLSITFRCGKRLNCWKTIPICWRIADDVDALPRDLLALEEDPTLLDRLEQVHAAQECALAATARPDHDEHLAALHAEVDPVEDEVVAEALADAIEPDDRFGQRLSVTATAALTCAWLPADPRLDYSDVVESRSPPRV